MTHPDPEAEALIIGVLTDVAADGTYVPTLECGQDHSKVLNRDNALRHALAVIAACEYAEYDAAVLAEQAPYIVNDLAKHRTPDPS